METFVNYRGYRWLWINVAFTALLIAWYLVDTPIGGPRGGTLYGYTVGTLSALAVAYLLWFAVRKRSHFSGKSTLKGCLAVHVWLGIFVSIWVALHAGFNLHFNVHSLAYILLLLVVITGIWGVFLYRRLPADITSNRGGASLKALKDEAERIDDQIDAIIKGDVLLAPMSQALRTEKPELRIFRSIPYLEFDRYKAQSLLIEIPSDKMDVALKLIGLIDKEYETFYRLARESRVLAQLKFWLYIHVPVSVGLAGALTIHIISVFCYW